MPSQPNPITDWYSPPPPPPTPPPAPPTKRGNPRWSECVRNKRGRFAKAKKPKANTNVISVHAESPVARPPPPQVHLFSYARKEDLLHRPHLSPQQPEPEVAQRSHNEPKMTGFFLNDNGHNYRRKPDVSALNSLVREHLGLTTPSPTPIDSRSGIGSFFAHISKCEKDMSNRGSNPYQSNDKPGC